MFKITKKIKVIFIVVVLVILLAGGFFYYWQNRKTLSEKLETSEIIPKENYILKEISGERIVENKNVGLTFKIPENWVIENDNSASFHSSDAEFNETRNDVLKNGCRIELLISVIKTNIATIEKYLNEDFSKWSSVMEMDESKKIEISSYSALKHKYHIKQTSPDRIKMAYISVDMPTKEFLYKILLSMALQSAEYCELEFKDFLETVSIK